MPKVFISYSNKLPDKEIAEVLKQKFQQEAIETFFAPDNIDWGDNWTEKIETEINSFDYFLVLLSHNSKISDMVLEEIRRAKKHYDSKPEGEKPTILPLRIKLPMAESINYDIDAFLNKFQHKIINDKNEIDDLFEQALKIIHNKSSNLLEKNEIEKVCAERVYSDILPTPVAPLELPGGAAIIDSPYYVIRNGEEAFIKNIQREGSLLLINAPRQYGKTSLLARIIDYSLKNNHFVAPLSMQILDQEQVDDLNQLMIQVCINAAERCKISSDVIEAKIDELWKNKFDRPKRKGDKFFENFLLPAIDRPVVLVFDEVDRLFKTPAVCTEFFSLLRAWSDQSRTPGKEVFKKLKIVISYSSEILLAIQDVNQSPFNIGYPIFLHDFSEREVNILIQKHGLQLTVEESGKLIDLVGGHPYLVRKALYHITNKDFTLKELFDQASSDGGPFDDHLKRHFWNINRRDGYARYLKEILDTGKLNNNDVCIRLRAAGLITGDAPNVKIKNTLYKSYFENRL